MNASDPPGASRYSGPVRLPPGPPRRWWGLPLLRAMSTDYLAFTGDLQRKFGDITYMRLVNEHAYDVFAPEMVREVMVGQADRLVRWERGIDVFEQVFGQSVLVTEGATWQRQRRMLQPAFTPRRVAGYATLMCSASKQALESAVPPQHVAATVDMDTLFTRVAMDVILRTLFSSRASDESSDAAAAVQHLSQLAMREMFWPMTLPDWPPLPGKAAKRRALRTLRGLLARHIEARSALARPPTDDAATAPDLLSMLLSLRDETTGAALSQTEVFDQCMVTFQAGHETSATALLWWSRLLSEHPLAAQRARQEVDAVLTNGRDPEPQDLDALPWLTATLKEAMRLYPPIAVIFTRRASQPLQVADWTIPKGALIRITPWVIQRDLRWFDDPETFRPERFMPTAPSPPRGAWLAFGLGPRVCIGQHFAMLEITLVAALLLQRYRLELPPDAPPREAVANVTLRPRHPVRLRLVRRNEGT